MELLFKKYKRGVISLCLIFFFWLSSVVSSAYGMELTGFLLILAMGGSIFYLFVYWLKHRNAHKKVAK